QPDPTGELPVTTAKPPARYGAIGGARPGGFALPSYTTSGDTIQVAATARRYGVFALIAAAMATVDSAGAEGCRTST
ncbi:hypothetical protein, partial [Bradyrhizobium forestalis]|uniref:hypothetical protein n=1 Tax=Bradyrhizobium forestalis TaxID=1419263 RepID=UPI001ABF8152